MISLGDWGQLGVSSPPSRVFTPSHKATGMLPRIWNLGVGTGKEARGILLSDHYAFHSNQGHQSN